MDQNVSAPTTASNPVAGPQIAMLALEHIVPSGTDLQKRRRAHYDKSSLASLAANIKTVGVIEPIVTRALPALQGSGEYELVAGERRWLASRLAGLAEIPAIVRELSDQAALEIQLFENVDREDAHPLEEAEGYELLLRDYGYTLEDLSAKRNKDARYIRHRLQLLVLTQKSRDAFYAGTLNVSTAFLLARITHPTMQDEALAQIIKGYGGEPMSFREAQRHVHDTYMLRLKQAPFDKADTTLVPAAGACGACPKRTGNQPELFGDIKSADVCTDPHCFAAKRKAWAARLQARAEAEGRTILRGEAAQRIAPHGLHHLQGGYVALDDTCYEAKKLDTYRKLIGKALGPTALLEDARNGTFIEIIKRSDYADTLKDKGVGVATRGGANKEQRERGQAARHETAWRERVFVAIRAKPVDALAGADLRLVVRHAWRSLAHDQSVRLMRLCGWLADKAKPHDSASQVARRIDTLSEAQLRRLLVDCALIGEVHANTWSDHQPEALNATAQRLRIDTAHIRATLKAELAAKARGCGRPAATKTQAATAAKGEHSSGRTALSAKARRQSSKKPKAKNASRTQMSC